MNCYECIYFTVRVDNHLYEVPYCTKYKKKIPVDYFVYNFFCFDSELPYRSESNEPKRNNRIVIEKQQQTIDKYGVIYDVNLQQTKYSNELKTFNKRRNSRKRTNTNKRKFCNVSLYDFS